MPVLILERLGFGYWNLPYADVIDFVVDVFDDIVLVVVVAGSSSDLEKVTSSSKWVGEQDMSV